MIAMALGKGILAYVLGAILIGGEFSWGVDHADQCSASKEATRRDFSTGSPRVLLGVINGFWRYGIDNLQVSNDVWVVGGAGLLAHKKLTIEKFISASDVEVERAFQNYLERHPCLSRQTESLVVLDIEHPIHPKNIWKLGDNGILQERVVRAISLRIAVVRKHLPYAKLSLYGVVVPNPRGWYTAEVDKMMEGFKFAGAHGMFDELDYISPALYIPYGKNDLFYPTLVDFTRQGVMLSSRIKKSNGATFGLYPVVGVRVINGGSKHYKNCNDIDDINKQLTLLGDEVTSVKGVILWFGDAKSISDPDWCNPGDIVRKLFSVDRNASNS